MSPRGGNGKNGSFAHSSILSVSRDQFHRISFTEWGKTGQLGPVICVHGMTRQGRDFDFLAEVLAGKGYRVLCPDLVGRGLSGKLMKPADYDLEQYVVDMTVLMSGTGAAEFDWIGTSLGGLIGIIVAGMPNSPIRRLVVNDIGPDLPLEGVLRIGQYVRSAPAKFPSLEAAETYFREVLAPFGRLSESQWQHLSKHSVTPDGKGGYCLHYDRRLVQAFKPPWTYTRKLWNFWDKIRCPILVLRGAKSDLLPSKTAAEMATRNSRAKIVEILDCGHAPPLMNEEQIRIVTDWIEEQQPMDKMVEQAIV